MELNEEVNKMLNILSTIENELCSSEFDDAQNKYAMKKALKAAGLEGKIALFLNIILKKMGRISEYSLDQYRVDLIVRKNIQELKNRLILLECFQYRASELEKDGLFKTDEKKMQKPHLFEKLKNGYIAIIVESLDKGGMEQVVAFLAQGLQNKGIHVRVLCLNRGGVIADQLRSLNIGICEFYNRNSQFKKYIINNPPILANTHYVKRHIKFLYDQGIPVVEVIHNMYVFYCDHATRIERRNEKYFTKMIAVSELVKDTYRIRIKESNKLSVIGNAAIVREEPQKNREQVRKELGIREDGIVLLNVGSIDRRKNQLGIIKAFDIVTKIVDLPLYLVFAGNVQDEEYSYVVRDAILQCHAKKQIILLPYYSRVRELYQMADIFVLDSYYEGWSIAATEALYEGMPIIHSMCGSARELINNGRYGISISNPAGKVSILSNEEIIMRINRYEFNNTKELVCAILEMVFNIGEWKHRKEMIAEESRQIFSLESMIDNYCMVFENLVC